MELMISMNIYPDPFTAKISLEVTCNAYESTIVSLLDNQNKIIKMFSWQLKPGTNKTSLESLGSLPQGDYYLNMKDINGTIISKKLIQKS